MNQMIIIGLIMVGIGVVLMLFAHKMNEQNPRLSQYLAMTFLFLFLWGCAVMIWGSGGYPVAVIFALLGTALPLYCLKGMKGTENMSDDELRKYIDDGQTTHMVECVGGNPEENGMRYQLRAVTQIGDDYEWLDLRIYSETGYFQPGKVYIVMFRVWRNGPDRSSEDMRILTAPTVRRSSSCIVSWVWLMPESWRRFRISRCQRIRWNGMPPVIITIQS